MFCLLSDILIVSPSWTTYKPQALLAGKRAIQVNTKFEDNWKINPKDLEKVNGCSAIYLIYI